MELCWLGHGEVCYETNFCPACFIKEEMQEKINVLQEENDQLTIECDNLQKIIDSEKREEDR